MSHDVGDVVRLWAVFRDETGAQADPTDVTLTIRRPDYTTEEIANEPADAEDEALAEEATGQTLSGVTGVYKATTSIDQSGTWWYRWEGSGVVAEVQEGYFGVRWPRVTVES